MPLCAFPGSSNLLRLGEEVTMATLPRVNLRHLSHWSSQWNRLHLPHTYPYVLFTGELVGGTIDRSAVRETQYGNHATQLCPLAHWVMTYIQQRYTWRNVTAIFTSLVTETRPQQMWRTVTAIYTRLTAETWWQQFFRRLSNCDAPSHVTHRHSWYL